MDNLVSRYVRPLIIVYLIAFFSIISIADALSDDFNMRDIYINVYATILQAAVGFYFTSRGVEKSVRIYRENAGPINKNSKDDKETRNTKDSKDFRIFEDIKDIKK